MIAVFLNRPLAMQGLQRIITPVALANSFSSTIYRVVLLEGKASVYLGYVLTIHSSLLLAAAVELCKVLLTFSFYVFLVGQS